MSDAIPDTNGPDGIVEIYGPISYKQFYYQDGDSDADTVKIKVKVDSVRFRANKNDPWIENLHLFDDAFIGKTRVVSKKDRTMNVRLQGIDAPELHYQAQSRGLTLSPEQKKKWMNQRFRQRWGAKSVYELERFLKPYVKSDVIERAYVFSRVDHPNDVFDVYGRFVGDIIVSRDDGTNKKNINQWLVEQGWAFPTFYNSMTSKEIRILDKKGRNAQRVSKGIWKALLDRIVPFNPKLHTPRGKNAPRINHKTDKGRLNLPKIFRRQIDFEVRKRAKVTNELSLSRYIKSKKKDKCYLTKDFLARGAKAKLRHLSEFVDTNGEINFTPHELTFKEDLSSVLKDSKGKKIEKWE
jgi:endonuclease YncB( thermonuclease family)/bifunctional DNA-binding transcriptional regulator/antitoxin component of YhaV-PrlF toxin-antitoxin module